MTSRMVKWGYEGVRNPLSAQLMVYVLRANPTEDGVMMSGKISMTGSSKTGRKVPTVTSVVR